MSTLSKWYRGIRLPNWGSSLVSWLTPSAGLLSSILPGNVPIVFADSELTAYADRKNHRIVLGTNFLSADESKRLNPFATKEESVTFALGACVHEAAHFAWSPDTIQDLLNAGVANNKHNGFIANIVEDIYIEDRMIKEHENLAWMILGAWAYMFDPRSFKSLDKWDGLALDSAPLEDVLNYIVYWKYQTTFIPVRSDAEKELQDLFYSVRGMNELQDRKDLVEKIVAMFATVTDEVKEEPKSGEDVPDTVSTTGQEVDADAYVFVAAYGEVKYTGNDIVVELEAVGGNTVIVTECASSNATVTYDKRWTRFAEIAKQRGAVRNVMGPAAYSAKRLTHPANLTVNGKVFSKNTLSSTSGNVGQAKPEFVLLLDFSQSMTAKNKYAKTIAAAYGAVHGMIDAGMKFAVYGYTTDHIYKTNLLVKIKSFDEPGSVALGRLSHLTSNRSDAGMTPDIIALQFAAKRFLSNSVDRVMVVVTDGEPSYDFAGNQNPTAALVDAATNVANIRKTGIKVFGLSIDYGADSAVSKIYGSDALFSSDPNVMEVFLRKFI